MRELAFALLAGADTIGEGQQLAEQLGARDPDGWRALDLLGWAHHRSGNAERAAALLRRARATASGDATVRWHLGAALHASGNASAAAVELRAALALDPGFDHAERAAALLDEIRGDGTRSEVPAPEGGPQ